ncbi:MAG: GNAT family N-acetyltransferase [Candidatus Micrarchaeota archaeon]|nr:GNAT family N-acetyltransferase [Candidatus Micrarchaeota archaeon]
MNTLRAGHKMGRAPKFPRELAEDRKVAPIGFQIKRYSPARDCAMAKDLNRIAVLNSSWGKAWREDWNIAIDYIRRAYLANRGEFLVVYHGEKMVGMGGFQKVDGQTAIIKKIRTHPEHRREGIASLLMKKLEEKAREFGYAKLRAGVEENNAPMQELCRKLGFGLKGKECEYEQDGLHFVLFEKSL